LIVYQCDKLEDLSKIIGCSLGFISKAIKHDLAIFTALRLTSKNDKAIALLSGINTSEKQRYKIEKIKG
jgi:hypothetical protein